MCPKRIQKCVQNGHVTRPTNQTHQPDPSTRPKKREQKPAKAKARNEHAEAFKVAFDEAFPDADGYEWTTADFVQLAKWQKTHPSIPHAQFAAVAQGQWSRGKYMPKASLTIRGVATSWSTFVAQQTTATSQQIGADGVHPKDKNNPNPF